MSHRTVRALAWPGYFFAFLLIVFPVGDLVVNVWPPRIGELQWRYGTLGLLSGFWLTPLFGVAFLVACAAALEHRGMFRLLSILSIAVAVLLAALLVLFILDWLQVRTTFPPEGRGFMDVGSLKAIAKHVLVTLLFAWVGVASLRASWGKSGEHRGRSIPPLVREASPKV